MEGEIDCKLTFTEFLSIRPPDSIAVFQNTYCVTATIKFLKQEQPMGPKAGSSNSSHITNG